MPTVKNERVEMILNGLGRLAQLRLPVAGAAAGELWAKSDSNYEVRLGQ